MSDKRIPSGNESKERKLNNSTKMVVHYCPECGEKRKTINNDNIAVSTLCSKHQISESGYEWVGEIKVFKKFSPILKKVTRAPVLSKPQANATVIV